MWQPAPKSCMQANPPCVVLLNMTRIEKLEILRGMFHTLDYSDYMGQSQVKRIRAITAGMDFVLSMSESEQKDFKQIATELGKAHGLCAASNEGKAIALEVSYFKSVKASLVKLDTKEGKGPLSKAEIEQRINQILERSIISQEAIDVFEAMGMKHPDISILNVEFLEEVKNLKTKNLALEMLKKLLEGEIKVMERSNLVKSELFSEKLKKALIRYRNQAITNAEVIEELIRLAKEIKKMHKEEADMGLSKDEIAFYYALAKDEVARKFYDDDTLKKIAQELTDAIRRNVTIDFNVRIQAQATMRNIIHRLLRKYKYPPEQAKEALNIVMRQVELMCSNEADAY